jgi:pyruvate/2-oxoglutarate/acetoin dehydrogenase E1 component
VEAGVPLRQVCRLAGADVPIGFSPALEGAAFPNTQQIADALKQFL